MRSSLLQLLVALIWAVLTIILVTTTLFSHEVIVLLLVLTASVCFCFLWALHRRGVRLAEKEHR